ncbi:MAG: selenocysteine-specific translation elongation factor [Bryobacterales bacterium]|jgi:selenocysteine-specific elongation factor|nr:selenocysteine-specific translation elongation factor [Bryobacterales bacterium]
MTDPGQPQIRIAGTAGHIDHGKSSLVRALTGQDPDRLKEEKERGITIDLGFASSTLPNDIILSWIDVPGHERFVGNMLAGAAGIDFVLLVVAANEGVMPQTVEHFHICRLLGIRHGMVVLTKCDLADELSLRLARAQIEALVSGSFLDGAPVREVSSHTGQGMAGLVAELANLAEAVPPRSHGALFRMPVDRAFTMKGFGTVVTGTVFDGAVRRDEELLLLPAGLPVRVRGIQRHGASQPDAQAGQRAAINLAGIEVDDVQRGDVLVRPGGYQATRRLDARVELVEDAPPLVTLSPVHLHVGTKECVGRIRFHDGLRVLLAGETGFARLHLDEDVVVLPGDRFILRRFSPLQTLGGGMVLDNQPPRLRRKQPIADRLRVLEQPSLTARVSIFAREQSAGLEAANLSPRVGAPVERILHAADEASLRRLGPKRTWLIGSSALEAIAERIQSALAAFHRDHPVLPGAPKDVVRGHAGADVPPMVADWVLAGDPRFRLERDLVRLASHEANLDAPEAAIARRMEQQFLDAGLHVPDVEEVLRQSGVDATRARTLLQLLIREGKLVKVGADLVFHKHVLGNVVRMLAQRRGQRFGVADFKEWTGVSRKYAIPLLEFLDRQRITRRDGDVRLIL